MECPTKVTLPRPSWSSTPTTSGELRLTLCDRLRAALKRASPPLWSGTWVARVAVVTAPERLFCRTPGWARPWTAACLMGSWGRGRGIRLVAFAAGGCWLGLLSSGCQLVVLEGLLDAPRGGGADALVDRQCLP